MTYWALLDDSGNVYQQLEADDNPAADYGWSPERTIKINRLGLDHEVLRGTRWVVDTAHLRADLIAAVDRVRDKRLEQLLPAPGRRAVYETKLRHALAGIDGAPSALIRDEAAARGIPAPELARAIMEKAAEVTEKQGAIEISAAAAKTGIADAGENAAAMRRAAAAFMENDDASHSR